jgi:hypothetical protein
MSNDAIWETFDGLFKTLHRQGRQIEELTERVSELNQRLTAATTQNSTAAAPPVAQAPVIEGVTVLIRSPVTSPGYAVVRDGERLSFMPYAKPLPEDEFRELATWVLTQPELGPGCELIWKENENV